MNVPVAVITLVLLASAVSTQTLNNVNETFPDVDQAFEVSSSKETLQNETVMASNKSTNALEEEPYAEPLMKKPSNIPVCTQNEGVRSTCVQAGKRIKGDKLGVKKVIKKAGKANSEQSEAFSYVVKPHLVKKGFVISHITVTNKMKMGTEGLVAIVKGGTLETEVMLLMESQTGRRMHFLVEIYVGPVASAYKAQLGSLISNLKSL